MTASAPALSAVFRELMAEVKLSVSNSTAFRDDSPRVTEALAADLIASGIDPAAIRIEENVSEQAKYRVSPYRWDMVLVSQGIPVVVIEWMMLSSSSLKNYNNRLDGIVATANGLRASFAQADAAAYGPHLAFLFIADPAGGGASRDYLDVFAGPLRDMVTDGLVDCACVLRFDPVNLSLADFSADLGFDQFAASIVSFARSPQPGRAFAADLSPEVGRLFAHGNARGFASGLASTAAGQAAVEATIIENRRKKIRQLQELAATAGTTETQMQRAIGKNYWIFGGQYVDLGPRGLATLDQYDFALICADRSLHIIELKRPDAKLVEPHRNHTIVSGDVHKAVSQCLNYLRALDEQGPVLQVTWRNERHLDVDFRRAKATVVIGSLDNAGSDDNVVMQLQQTIRSYNAHLTRIEVITYSELLDAADRALRFETQAEELTSDGR